MKYSLFWSSLSILKMVQAVNFIPNIQIFEDYILNLQIVMSPWIGRSDTYMPISCCFLSISIVL